MMQEVVVSLLHEIRTDWCTILVVILLLRLLISFAFIQQHDHYDLVITCESTSMIGILDMCTIYSAQTQT